MKKKVPLEEIFDETIEDKLYNVRKEIAVLTELGKKYSAQVLTQLREKGTKRGDKFKISLRQTLKIVDPDTAFKWAAERNCIDVNTSKAMRLIRREFEVPNGFQVQATEYLSMRSANPNETDAEDTEADG